MTKKEIGEEKEGEDRGKEREEESNQLWLVEKITKKKIDEEKERKDREEEGEEEDYYKKVDRQMTTKIQGWIQEVAGRSAHSLP